MTNILILYSSIDGHTLTICWRLQQVIEQESHSVTIASIDDAQGADLTLFDKIAIGTSIRHGQA